MRRHGSENLWFFLLAPPHACTNSPGTSGYDRSRFLRRTRFDSIPEEVPEEDCEDEYDEEVRYIIHQCMWYVTIPLMHDAVFCPFSFFNHTAASSQEEFLNDGYFSFRDSLCSFWPHVLMVCFECGW